MVLFTREKLSGTGSSLKKSLKDTLEFDVEITSGAPLNAIQGDKSSLMSNLGGNVVNLVPSFLEEVFFCKVSNKGVK